jgi:hypothetical protein
LPTTDSRARHSLPLGIQTSDTTGTITITATGCKIVVGIGDVGCNTLGDAKEIELLPGTVADVWDAKPKTGPVAVLLSLDETALECTPLFRLKYRGHVLCLVATPLTLVKTHTISCSQSKGKQRETSFFNDEEKAVNGQHLEVSTNGGAFDESGLMLTAGFEFTKEVAFMNE